MLIGKNLCKKNVKNGKNDKRAVKNAKNVLEIKVLVAFSKNQIFFFVCKTVVSSTHHQGF